MNNKILAMACIIINTCCVFSMEMNKEEVFNNVSQGSIMKQEVSDEYKTKFSSSLQASNIIDSLISIISKSALTGNETDLHYPNKITGNYIQECAKLFNTNILDEIKKNAEEIRNIVSTKENLNTRLQLLKTRHDKPKLVHERIQKLTNELTDTQNKLKYFKSLYEDLLRTVKLFDNFYWAVIKPLYSYDLESEDISFAIKWIEEFKNIVIQLGKYDTGKLDDIFNVILKILNNGYDKSPEYIKELTDNANNADDTSLHEQDNNNHKSTIPPHIILINPHKERSTCNVKNALWTIIPINSYEKELEARKINFNKLLSNLELLETMLL